MRKRLSNSGSALVFDCGASHTKCGRAGEAAPRHTIVTPSEVTDLHTQWPKRGPAPKVEEILARYVRLLTLETLGCSAQGKQVVLCWNVNFNESLLELMAKLLKERFQATQVTTLSSALATMYPTESLTGMVVDCGWQETRCCPVVHGNVLAVHARYVNVGAKHVLEALKHSIIELNPELSQRPSQDQDRVLTRSFLEDVLVKACKAPRDADVDTTVTSIQYPSAHGLLTVDVHAWARVLLDPSQHLEGWCLGSCLLDCLYACDPVIRALVAGNVVLAGGIADLDGLRQAFMQSSVRLCNEDSRYTTLRGLMKSLRLSIPAFPSFMLPWAGASLATSVVSAATPATDPLRIHRSGNRKSSPLTPLLPTAAAEAARPKPK